MSAAEPTPGQAAYEAFYAGTECGAPVPWAQLTDWDEHWVAAALAAIEADHRQPLSVAVRALRTIAWGSAEGKPIDPSVVADKALMELRRRGMDEEAVADLAIAAAAPAPAAPTYQMACGCNDGDGKKYTPVGAWYCGVHGQTTIVTESAAPQEPQPQAAPAPDTAMADSGEAMREAASRELASAMAESRHYREALAEIASHDNDPITQVRIIARAARRALEGK